MKRLECALIALALSGCEASLGAGASGTGVAEVQRPPPLVAQPECQLWSGTISGNDPSAQITLRLCPSNPAVASALAGRLQWSSTRSGWSERDVAGTATPDGVVLADTRIAENHPAPGWRFCSIDRYDLKRTEPNHLTGSYDSAACRDHASVDLHLVP